ncbi:hypothetical protein ACAW74_12415 [Fibrella sp. WM1]|uniref:hypothetical protein n=1 Tax=Fibrella musci TaxID=3242485 RepID=UPI0035203125
MIRPYLIFILVLVCASFANGQPKDVKTARKANREILKRGKWGVFTHYLADTPGSPTPTPGNWNQRINRFNVTALANQLAAAHASYYFITIGQNSGYYCAPNSTYDKLVGHPVSHCSQRDLITDLAKALASKGIKLGVYIPANAPENDKQAVDKLGWMRGDHRNAEFQRRWESVIKDWSLRWGKNIFAWWVDGAFFADAMYRQPEPPNFQSFAAALRAGNPDALVAFNPGINTVLKPMTEHEDFTAGEVDFYLPLPGRLPYNNNLAINTAEGLKGEQLHYLSFLGEWWGRGKPRFPTYLISAYTRYVNDQGGVMTWDVPISDAGLIPTAFITQLKALPLGSRSR